MLVDEYGGEQDTEGKHEAAEPHHHPGDCSHVNHCEVGVLHYNNRFRRAGGNMVSDDGCDHQVVLSHEEKQASEACCQVGSCLEQAAHWLN